MGLGIRVGFGGRSGTPLSLRGVEKPEGPSGLRPFNPLQNRNRGFGGVD